MAVRGIERGRWGLRAVAAVQLIALIVSLALPATVGAEEPWDEYALGLVPSEVELPLLDTSHLRGPSLLALPPVVDLSAHLPPIGNQGGQGSCVGWALGYYYKSYQESVERAWSMTDPGHQFSPAYLYNQRSTSDCDRDAGMSFYGGLSILRDKGAASLAAFPYDANDTCTTPSASVQQAALPYHIDDFAPLYMREGTADINTLKALLAQGQAFAIAVPVYSNFYRVTASNPVLQRPSESDTFYGGHAMFVVGYDDARGGFKTANSWGSNWGLGGYVYLSYDFVQFDTWEAWTMTDHVEAPAPVQSATFSGAVTLNGAAAPAGTRVAAWIAGTKVGEATTTLQDGAARYTLQVPADDPATPAREGGVKGDTIAFTVNDLTTTQNATWKSGASTTENLSATNPEAEPQDPTPTPTPMPTPTPDPDPQPSACSLLWLPVTRR